MSRPRDDDDTPKDTPESDDPEAPISGAEETAGAATADPGRDDPANDSADGLADDPEATGDLDADDAPTDDPGAEMTSDRDPVAAEAAETSETSETSELDPADTEAAPEDARPDLAGPDDAGPEDGTPAWTGMAGDEADAATEPAADAAEEARDDTPAETALEAGEADLGDTVDETGEPLQSPRVEAAESDGEGDGETGAHAGADGETDTAPEAETATDDMAEIASERGSDGDADLDTEATGIEPAHVIAGAAGAGAAAATATAGAASGPASGAYPAASAPERKAAEPEPHAVEAYEAEHAAHHDVHDEEGGGRSLSGVLLTILVALLVGAGAALWGGPKIAPYVPGPVAKYLAPPSAGDAEALADLEARLAAQESAAGDLAALEAKLAALETALADGAGGAQVDPVAVAAAVDAAAEAAQAEIAARIEGLARELTETRERLSGLESQITVMTDALTATADGQSGDPALRLAAALEALKARIDGLDAKIGGAEFLTADDAAGFAEAEALAAVSLRADDLAAEIDALRADFEAAVAEIGADRDQALGEAEQALKAAARRGAAATLMSQAEGGLPYRAALTELESLTGATPPEALAARADRGLPTPQELADSLPRHARAAIEADIRATVGEGTTDRITAWLSTQVSVRPTAETEGADVPAILSRVEARVGDGALAEALAEADSLPGPAAAALGPWLAELEASVAGRAALEIYLTETGAGD